MKDFRIGNKTVSEIWSSCSVEALGELKALGLSGPQWAPPKERKGLDPIQGIQKIKTKAIVAPQVINEAFRYDQPSSFSRGVGVELPGVRMLFLSGTASVDENGKAAYPGDFRAQCLRTYRNLTHLLISEGASWHNVVRTTCYLRDIERDYSVFNEIRTLFFQEIGLDPLPASTGIQARLCWSELLVEIELIALVPSNVT